MQHSDQCNIYSTKLKIEVAAYSSHQFSVTLRTEIVDLANVANGKRPVVCTVAAISRYSLQQPGFLPGHNAAQVNGNGNGRNETWTCSPKQRTLILENCGGQKARKKPGGKGRTGSLRQIGSQPEQLDSLRSD